jgi:hypothetical protein
MIVNSDLNARTAEVRLVITRADGRVEDLGRVAYWHRNPIRRALGNALIWIKEKLR